jgi:5'(3')-deoxyribonucleotidase
MQTMKRVAVDMDDVLAQTYRAERAWMATPAPGPGLRDEAALEAMMQEGAFFADLAVMPDSQRVLAAMAQRYEIVVATAAMEYPRSFGPKFAWLQRHFPFISPSHLVFCGDKSVVQADFLIDDHPRHFQRFAGQGILYTAAHNLAETRYPRVGDWQDLERLFLSDGFATARQDALVRG